MARKRRVMVPKGVYHIIQRGNNRAFVFQEVRDKRRFLDILTEVKDLLPFHLLYYVMMDNHYHLLIETIDESIGRVMHRINMYYALYYNKTYGRSGTLFGGRYSASLVTDQAYFLQLIRYMAMNPVKANLVKRPEDYPFSAHGCVVGKRMKPLDKQRLLAFLHDSPIKAKKKYINLLKHPAKPIDGLLVDPEHRADYRQKQLQHLLTTQVTNKKNRRLIRSGSRQAPIIAAKRLFIRSARDKDYSFKEIARFLDMTERAIRYLDNATEQGKVKSCEQKQHSGTLRQK